MFDVFLSHNSVDKPAVKELANRLLGAGLKPFLDTWHLIPGEKWQPAIEEALEESGSAAIFIGPSGISPWHNEEMQAAIAKAISSRDEYRVIPVLLPGADEQVVTGFIGQRTWVDFRAGLDSEESFRALVAGVTGVPPQQHGAVKLPDEPAPYRGLHKFEPRHAALFFGREREIQAVLKKLEQSSFAAVVGASGAGKSSLVQAGVIPRLEHSKTWAAPIRMLLFTPGTNPLQSVAYQAISLLPQEKRLKGADELEERMLQRPDGLRTALMAWSADPDAPRTIVLVIDQLEELFTYGSGAGSSARIKAFADNLCDVAEHGAERIRVLTTVRADFLDHFKVVEPLRKLLLGHDVQLSPMKLEDYHDAIVRPAAKVGAQFQTGVVKAFMRELKDQSNVLPLLEYALDLLWRNRAGIWLTTEAYDAMGGLRGALRKHADDCFQLLEAEDKLIARDIFLRLVSLGEGGGPDTKRRVRLDELSALGANREQIDRVVQRLSGPKDRLLVVDRAAGHASPEVEICHEILIQEWPVLRAWVDGERRRLQAHRRLGAAAREWADHGRSADFLLTGARLAECEQYLTPQSTALNELELAFLFASLEARYDALKEDDRWHRELADSHRRADFQAAQVKERDERLRQLQRALAVTRSRELAGTALRELTSDPQAALLLLQEAYRTAPTETVDGAMRRYHSYAGRVTFKGHSGSVMGAAFSPDGRQVVTASLDGTARIWDATTRRERVKLQGHAGVVLSAAFSPDGRRVMTSGEDGTARVWDATSGQELLKLKGHTGAVWSTAFGPDGSTAATADADGTVYLWSLAAGRSYARLEGHAGAVLSVAFNPDGSRVVTASKDETARVWDAAWSRLLANLVGHAGWVRSAAFSPDGTVVVTGGQDGTARLWNATSGEALARVESHSGAVMTTAFSPNGRWLLMGGERGSVRVLDAASRAELEKLEGHSDDVMAAAFSPDSLRVVTASRDTTARVWDAASRRGIGRLKGHAGAMWCAAYSHDGRRVMTAGEDGTLRLWDAATRELVSKIQSSGVVRGVAFSPDDREVVSAGEDGVVRFWEVSTGRELAKLKGHFGWVWAAAFNLDGTRVVTVGHDGTARIWDRARRQELVRLEGHAGATLSAAFSPDGRRVVTASQDGTARLWDVESGKELAILNSQSGAVWSVAFSPDGHRVATANHDGIVRLWDAASYQELAKLEGHSGVVWSVAFSADGRRLGSAGQDGTARVWDAASGRELARLDDRSHTFLVAAFSPDGKRLITAGNDGTARLWPSWLWEPADDRLLALEAGRPFTPEERRRLLHE
ncbi:MAG TPA: TIR domain-containing protein [Myxococcaceae bacterium]